MRQYGHKLLFNEPSWVIHVELNGWCSWQVNLPLIQDRIQQLRYYGLQAERAKKLSCENVLSPLAWKILWLKTEKGKPSKQAPNLHWAYLRLGKLAGWNDSKRTGIVGWERLWEGWFKLQTILEGYQLGMSLEQEMLSRDRHHCAPVTQQIKEV